jgi:hypothetical protein
MVILDFSLIEVYVLTSENDLMFVYFSALIFTCYIRDQNILLLFYSK